MDEKIENPPQECKLGHECTSGCQKDFDCPCASEHDCENIVEHEHRYYPNSRQKSETCIICGFKPVWK